MLPLLENFTVAEIGSCKIPSISCEMLSVLDSHKVITSGNKYYCRIRPYIKWLLTVSRLADSSCLSV